MDFLAALNRVAPQIRRVVTILSNDQIAPALRQQALSAAFQQIGASVYGSAYRMTAWDFDIFETIGKGLDPLMALGLARTVSNGPAVGNVAGINEQVATYMIHAADTAMADATTTAGQLGKYRTLTINLRGRGDCDWCRAKARRGKIINPTNEDFRRHGGCDCFYEVQGFRSRNGELKNYRPARS